MCGQLSEATHTADVLEGEFYLPVEGLEAESRDTFENAGLAAGMATTPKNFKIVCAHFIHMDRVYMSFEWRGFSGNAGS